MKIHTARQADPVFGKQFLRLGSFMIISTKIQRSSIHPGYAFCEDRTAVRQRLPVVITYDKDRFQAANPLNRFAIGDR
jgi:hypothetical protein